MTKLYISYYGTYMSILEGYYNKKKNKYKIINSIYLDLGSEVDRKDINIKQKILKKTLESKKFKSKNVVLSISTQDLVCKKVSIPKVNEQELNGILENGLEEFIHIDRQENYYSYEVVDEKVFEGKMFLDIVIGSALKQIIDEAITLMEFVNLKVEAIDILPVACSRVINEFESKSMMIVNSGSYGTIVTIYKDNSLFTYEYIPAKLNKSNGYDYAGMISVIEEVRGLMTYYSSRNFGNTVDDILLIGEIANHYNVKDDFESTFTSNILVGINDLFDIRKDIIGSLENIDLYIENLGMMKRDTAILDYSSIDLSPKSLKDYRLKRKNQQKYIIIGVGIIMISIIPYTLINSIIKKQEHILSDIQLEINKIKDETSIVDGLESKIKLKNEELEQYKMLFNNKVTWESLLTEIDKKVPSKMEIEDMVFSYEGENLESEEKNKKEENILDEVVNEAVDTYIPGKDKKEESKDIEEQPIYKQIPNTITINGKAKTPEVVGQFVYKINEMNYFNSVKLNNVTEQSNNNSKIYSFNIVMKIKKEVIMSEQD